MMKHRHLLLFCFAFCTSAQGSISTNYKGASTNKDGSVDIIEPRHRIQGIDYEISAYSSLRGVCARHGFAHVVSQSLTHRVATGEEVAAIGDNGSLQEKKSAVASTRYSAHRRERPQFGWVRREVISSITCSSTPIEITYKVEAERFLNDDGSVWLSNPKITFSNGHSQAFVATPENYDRICSHMEQSAAVPGSSEQTLSSFWHEGLAGFSKDGSILPDAIPFADQDVSHQKTREDKILSVACMASRDASQLVSKRYENVRRNDDDGFYTILDPVIGNEKKTWRIAVLSDLDAVCHRLGYRAAAPNARANGTDALAATVDEDGFIQYIDFRRALHAISCVK
jgi:hypothetical protein